jgi:hypothetical protein
MLTLQAIQGIQFVFNVSFFFFRIELGTKTHGFRYFEVFLGNAVKAYCDWVVNFRTSLMRFLTFKHDEFVIIQFLGCLLMRSSLNLKSDRLMKDFMIGFSIDKKINKKLKVFASFP